MNCPRRSGQSRARRRPGQGTGTVILGASAANGPRAAPGPRWNRRLGSPSAAPPACSRTAEPPPRPLTRPWPSGTTVTAASGCRTSALATCPAASQPYAYSAATSFIDGCAVTVLATRPRSSYTYVATPITVPVELLSVSVSSRPPGVYVSSATTPPSCSFRIGRPFRSTGHPACPPAGRCSSSGSLRHRPCRPEISTPGPPPGTPRRAAPLAIRPRCTSPSDSRRSPTPGGPTPATCASPSPEWAVAAALVRARGATTSPGRASGRGRSRSGRPRGPGAGASTRRACRAGSRARR